MHFPNSSAGLLTTQIPANLEAMGNPIKSKTAANSCEVIVTEQVVLYCFATCSAVTLILVYPRASARSSTLPWVFCMSDIFGLLGYICARNRPNTLAIASDGFIISEGSPSARATVDMGDYQLWG